uniref:Uncharacterized protein n=1 Tax=Arundo donax TaxID=35708 RepID=A0A0A8Z5N5_ARUDO
MISSFRWDCSCDNMAMIISYWNQHLGLMLINVIFLDESTPIFVEHHLQIHADSSYFLDNITMI